LSSPETYLANLESSKADSSQSLASHDNDHNEEADGHDTVTGVTTNSSTSHDHNTDHGEPSSIVTFAGKFHPMLTHFPIALVISALVFSILAVVFQIQTMDQVSVYSVYLAALTGVGTVILGLAAGSAANYPTFLNEYLSWHRLLGITTSIVTILTAFAGRRYLLRFSKGTALLYRIALVTNAVLVGVTGHLGATLVFGPDHFNF